MIAAVDVHYDESRSSGRAAAVVFGDWGDAAAVDEFLAVVDKVEDYIPGEFYRRELPCALAVLGKIDVPLDAVVVDGYVRLNGKPGLGAYLYEALGRKTAVIGIAKSRFRDAPAHELLRGESKSPLFVSAVGVEEPVAAGWLARMHGNYRIPTMLKRADRLARGIV